jgi:hypothetical protein
MEQVLRHTHNGIDSEKLQLKDMVGFPLEALTGANNNALSSSGTENLIDSLSLIHISEPTRPCH